MKNSNKKYLYTIVIVALVLITNVTFGQVVPPPTPPPPPPGVPFGAVELLVAGLAAYGAKKLYKKK